MSTLIDSIAIGALSLSAALAMTHSGVGASPVPAPRQAVRPDAERAAHMREHFKQVMAVHTAVIRGDLPAIKPPATWVAEHEGPASLPAGSAPYIGAMKQAAQRAADATDIGSAAAATAVMLTTCGDCHRAVGTMPAAPLPSRSEVGGVVGHMLRHQQAADQMLQGLIVPSNSLWQQGAEALKEAPLRPQSLPVDSQHGREMANAEERIHGLASQAAQATDSSSRANSYAQLLAGCAECHVRHAKIWGPAPR